MTSHSPLDNLKIATPCRTEWDKMEFVDDVGRVRHCRGCQKNVYRVSMMRRAEADDLFTRYEGNLGTSKLCVGFARRDDGTIIIGDCPVGKRETRRTRVMLATIVALLFLSIPSQAARGFRRMTVWTLRHVPPLALLEETSVGKNVFTWLDTPEPQVFNSVSCQMNS